jgi:hypothetical protein
MTDRNENTRRVNRAIVDVAAWARSNRDLIIPALRQLSEADAAIANDLYDLLGEWSTACEREGVVVEDAFARPDEGDEVEAHNITKGILSDVQAQLLAAQAAHATLYAQWSDAAQAARLATRALARHEPFSVRDAVAGIFADVDDLDGVDVEKLMEKVRDHLDSLDLEEFLIDREWDVTVLVNGTVRVTARTEEDALEAVREMPEGDVVSEMTVDSVDVDSATVDG